MNLVREYQGRLKISEPKDVFRYLREFAKEDREHFVVIGLNSANKIIYKDVVSVGILNACLVHPREIFKTAILKSAHSIIMAHNHPLC